MLPQKNNISFCLILVLVYFPLVMNVVSVRICKLLSSASPAGVLVAYILDVQQRLLD